jgi:hypothetical protein
MADSGKIPSREFLGAVECSVQKSDVDFFDLFYYGAVPGFPALDVRDIKE